MELHLPSLAQEPGRGGGGLAALRGLGASGWARIRGVRQEAAVPFGGGKGQSWCGLLARGGVRAARWGGALCCPVPGAVAGRGGGAVFVSSSHSLSLSPWQGGFGGGTAENCHWQPPTRCALGRGGLGREASPWWNWERFLSRLLF